MLWFDNFFEFFAKKWSNCSFGKLNALFVLKKVWLIKFIYFEKATKSCEIFPLLLSTVHAVKIKGKILQILWPSQNIWTLPKKCHYWQVSFKVTWITVLDMRTESNNASMISKNSWSRRLWPWNKQWSRVIGKRVLIHKPSDLAEHLGQ